MDNFGEEIKQRIVLISDEGRILFAAITTERLLPNYAFFQKRNNWGNIDILTDGLSLAYQSIFMKIYSALQK